MEWLCINISEADVYVRSALICFAGSNCRLWTVFINTRRVIYRCDPGFWIWWSHIFFFKHKNLSAVYWCVSGSYCSLSQCELVRDCLLGRYSNILKNAGGTYGPRSTSSPSSKKGGGNTKVEKWHLFTDKIDYSGHVIRPGGLKVENYTTDAIRDLKEPTTVTELGSFLGLCNVFRRFVPNFARISAPLNEKLRKGELTSFETLTEEEQSTMKELQERLITTPVLDLPRTNGNYAVDTEACDRQIGCVLLQEQPDGTTKPVAYW